MTLRSSVLAAAAGLAMTTASHAATFELAITFDNYPSDIDWRVLDTDGTLFGSNFGYTKALAEATITEAVTLDPGSYVFKIQDSYGDGLCCNEGDGGYTLGLDGAVFYVGDGQFGSGETIAFDVPDPINAVPLPAGAVLIGSALGAFGLFRRRRGAL